VTRFVALPAEHNTFMRISWQSFYWPWHW